MIELVFARTYRLAALAGLVALSLVSAGCNLQIRGSGASAAKVAEPSPSPSPPAAATSLSWSVSSPHFQAAANAQWSAASDLSAQSIQYFSDGNCGTTSGSAVNLALPTVQSHGFLAPSPGTYSFRVINEANGLTTASACSPALQIKQTFHAGIDFGADTVARTVNGNLWLTQAEAISTGLSFTTPYTTGSSTRVPSPAVNADTAAMMNSSVLRAGADLGFDLPLASGSYRIYFWVLENVSTNARSVNVRLEGTRFGSSLFRQPLDEWQRYGPFDVALTDGTLNVLLQFVSGDPQVMGMEIYKIEPAGSLVESDDFNALDLSRWTQWNAANAPATTNGNQIVLAPPANTTYYPGLSRAVTQSLADHAVVMSIAQMLTVSTGDENLVGMYCTNIEYIWRPNGDGIRPYYRTGGVTTWLSASIPYNSTNHHWLRVRHDSIGNWVLYETSPDAIDWTQHARMQASLGVFSCSAGFGAGHYDPIASPGSAIFDDYRLYRY